MADKALTLDDIVKGIAALPYADMRIFAMSMSDVLSDRFGSTIDADLLVPLLYDFSVSWEEGASDASQD